MNNVTERLFDENGLSGISIRLKDFEIKRQEKEIDGIKYVSFVLTSKTRKDLQYKLLQNRVNPDTFFTVAENKVRKIKGYEFWTIKRGVLEPLA